MRALFEPISAAPPWGWNPIGTAVEAFNNTRRTALAQQAEARLQEAQGIENEVKRMTLPYAGQKAMLEVENLRADIAQRQAAAQSALALADYRRSLARGEMTSSLDSLLPQHPGLSYLLGAEADDETAPARSTQSTSISDDSLRLAPPMLDSADPVSLDAVNAEGLPSASAADNPLIRNFAENRRPNVFDDLPIDTSKIPPEGMLADSSSGLTPTAMSAMKAAGDAMDAPTSSFEREEILQSARATLNQKQNPLLNLPIMSQAQPQPAERAEASVSELQRYVQTDKQVQSEYLRNRANLPKKERGLYDGQMSAQLKQLPIIVNQKFGLSDSAYNRVRDWNPESFARFETLRSEAQGSVSPDDLVELVNRENQEKLAEIYKRGKGAPAAVDLDAVKKGAELFDMQIEQETDPLKQGALKRGRADYIAANTGAQVTGRQYVQEYLNQRAAAPDDETRKALDTRLLAGLPQDDTAMSFSNIAEKAKPLKDPQKQMSFMRDALRSARDNGTLIVRPGAQGISILTPEQLTDEAIESMIAPPAPPPEPSNASADAPSRGYGFDGKGAGRFTRDAIDGSMLGVKNAMQGVKYANTAAADALYRVYEGAPSWLSEFTDEVTRREKAEPAKTEPTKIQGGLDFGLGEAVSKLLTPEESSDPEIRDEFAKNFNWRYDGKPPKIVKLGADPFPKGSRKYLDETWPVPDGKPEGKFNLIKVNGNWYAEEREPTSQKRNIVERLAKRAEDPDEAPKLNNLERAILEKEGYYQPSEEPSSRRQGAGAANMLGDAVNAIYGWKYDGREPGPAWQGSRVYKKREQ